MGRPGSKPSRRAVLGTGLTGLTGLTALAAGCSAPAPVATSSSGTAAPSPASPSAASSAAASPTVAGHDAAPAVLHPGPDLTHGSRTRDAVALTFHGDGPAELVRGVVRVLARADAHVTVLAIGRWLAAEPDTAKVLRDAGHELGNHTWSHQVMPRLTRARARDEVDRAAAELERLTGSRGRWFRPSGTPHSTAAIRAAATSAGYGACLGYDVDPLDYADPGPAAIARRLAASVRPGSIVSLHLGHPGTLAALPAVLSHLHDRGLTPVTASTLLLGS